MILRPSIFRATIVTSFSGWPTPRGSRMSNPCEYGFKCPYMSGSDEGELICTYPKLPEQIEEGETFGILSDTFCELQYDFGERVSLFDLIDIYEWSDQARAIIESEKRRMDEETRKIVEEIRKRQKERESND